MKGKQFKYLKMKIYYLSILLFSFSLAQKWRSSNSRKNYLNQKVENYIYTNS